jgi:hypothetical protein
MLKYKYYKNIYNTIKYGGADNNDDLSSGNTSIPSSPTSSGNTSIPSTPSSTSSIPPPPQLVRQDSYYVDNGQTTVTVNRALALEQDPNRPINLSELSRDNVPPDDHPQHRKSPDKPPPPPPPPSASTMTV